MNAMDKYMENMEILLKQRKLCLEAQVRKERQKRNHEIQVAEASAPKVTVVVRNFCG